MHCMTLAKEEDASPARCSCGWCLPRLFALPAFALTSNSFVARRSMDVGVGCGVLSSFFLALAVRGGDPFVGVLRRGKAGSRLASGLCLFLLRWGLGAAVDDAWGD